MSMSLSISRNIDVACHNNENRHRPPGRWRDITPKTHIRHAISLALGHLTTSYQSLHFYLDLSRHSGVHCSSNKKDRTFSEPAHHVPYFLYSILSTYLRPIGCLSLWTRPAPGGGAPCLKGLITKIMSHHELDDSNCIKYFYHTALNKRYLKCMPSCSPLLQSNVYAWCRVTKTPCPHIDVKFQESSCCRVYFSALYPYFLTALFSGCHLYIDPYRSGLERVPIVILI